MILVPNGKLLGKKLGDSYPYEEALAKAKLDSAQQEDLQRMQEPDGPGGRLYGSDDEYHNTMAKLSANSSVYSDTDAERGDITGSNFEHEEHPWGIFFTVLGTVLLDFDADACQSPSRAYLLDVTIAGTRTILLYYKDQ